MKRFASLLFSAALTASVFAATPARAQTAAFNPNDASFDFGTVEVGDSSLTGTLSFYRTNVLPLTNVTATNVALSDTTNYSIQDECTGVALLNPADPTVPNRSFCRIAVVFHPTVSGTLPATITITSNATNGPHVFNLTGEGVQPDIAVSITPAFADTLAGNDSAPSTVTVANNGDVDLHVGAVEVVGSDFTRFSVGNDTCSNATVIAGDSCTFEAVFSPNAEATFDANILVPSDDPDAPSFLLFVTGNGLANPSMTVKPASLLVEFPATGVGQTSLPQVVEIENVGFTALENVALTLPIAPYFSYLQDHCTGSTLQPGESCLVQVVFTPDAVGVTIDELITISADGVTSQTLTIRGEGAGGPALTVLPASGTLSFADTGVGQTSAAQVVEIHSVGTVTVENLAVTSPSVFPIVQDNCSGIDLAPGQSCVVLFAFAPDDVLSFNGTATLSTDTFGSGDLIDLEGEGVGGPLLSLSSSALSFGEILVGNADLPQLVQVRNSGTANVSISSVSNAGPDFFLGSDTCSGESLAAGESCFLQVIFQPTEAGNLSDTFTVNSDADNQPNEFTVEGEGVPVPVIPGVGLLQIKTNVLSFDLEDGGSASQSTTVTNVGDGPVEINALAVEGDSQFSQSNDCEGQTLQPGATCSVDVTFSTSSAGNFNAVVTIDSDPATSAFLVLLGSNLTDDIGGGGCSLGASAVGMGFSWLWIAPIFAAGWLRRRQG